MTSLTRSPARGCCADHVADGLSIARKHRLPTRIQDFIAEHHGTTVTKFQLIRARTAQGDAVNRSHFATLVRARALADGHSHVS